MSDKLLEFGLLLSDWKAISIIIIMSYLFVDRDRFTIAMCLEVLAMSFNGYIKTIFKVPLNPEIFSMDDGWAFPSGHTQSLAIILIYICWYYRKTWVFLGSIMIFSYAVICIERFGYHTWEDIAGGLVSAIIVFVFFIISTKYFKPSWELSSFACLILASLIQVALSLTSNLDYSRFYYYNAGASCFLLLRLIENMKKESKL